MSRTLRVSNLPPSLDSSMLEDMFTMVGDVRKAQVVINSETGKSRGYGFVEMSTHEEARDGILHFHGQSKLGQVLVVQANLTHVRKVLAPKPLGRRSAEMKTLIAAARKKSSRK